MKYIDELISKFDGNEEYLKIIYYCFDNEMELYDKSMGLVIFKGVVELCDLNKWINSKKYEIKLEM